LDGIHWFGSLSSLYWLGGFPRLCVWMALTQQVENHTGDVL
jgi:hypothetical protein